jgi:uncharacterized membrane protein
MNTYICERVRALVKLHEREKTNPKEAARRRFAWERAQIAAVLMAGRERRQRRLSLLLWLAIVALSALVFALTYHRCFGH